MYGLSLLRGNLRVPGPRRRLREVAASHLIVLRQRLDLAAHVAAGTGVQPPGQQQGLHGASAIGRLVQFAQARLQELWHAGGQVAAQQVVLGLDRLKVVNRALIDRTFAPRPADTT